MIEGFSNFQHIVITDDEQNYHALIAVNHVQLFEVRRLPNGVRYGRVTLTGGAVVLLDKSESVRLLARLGYPIDPTKTLDDV